LNRDRLRNRHLADQLLLRLIGLVSLQPLHAATERCDRAFTHVILAQRSDDGKSPAPLLRARTSRLRGGRRSRRAGAAAGARGLVVVGFGHRLGAQRRRRAGLRFGLVLAEPLLGFLLGLAFGLFVVTPALFLLALARFGGVALSALAAFAIGAPARLFLGN